MTIFVKNKHTLQIDEFKFRCSVGKKGSTKNKVEGDNKTPKGIFKIENLYFRKDRIDKPETSLKCIEIKHNMDEHWYSVKHCPFCSAEINSADNEDDLYYEDDEDYN